MSHSGSVGASPQLACVVMSLGNPPTLVEAVRSLQAQGEPVELVVVNSGGGDPAGSLERAGLEIGVISREARLYPGGARNLGLSATRAPFVAFLAADCIAEPGWVEGRLRRHLAGSLAVSSAVAPPRPPNTWSWVSYIALFSRRMPGTPEDQILHYGVSYARSLFDGYGFFREDLRSGEDSEFNHRLAGKVPITWAPDVRSEHRHPVTLGALGRDQFARGARMARTHRRLDGRNLDRRVALNAMLRLPSSLRLAWQAASPGDRVHVARAGLFLLPAAGVYALGALFSEAGWREEQEGRPDPKILAVLQFHNEMRFLPGYFQNVGPQVDGIVALDDGSTDGSGEFVARQSQVQRLVRIPPRTPHVWDEPRNRQLLIASSRHCGADWMLVVDADERLEVDFRNRARPEIARAEREGFSAYQVRLRELWDRPDRYRVDGVWGTKTPLRLIRVQADHEVDDRPLHGLWSPPNRMPTGGYPVADLIIYHLRMISPKDRAERQARYRRLDPENRFQAIGYDYLTDEAGLSLEPLPPGRGYEPLSPPDRLESEPR